MIGTEWKPSHIENDLYDIMESHEIGLNLYEEDVVEEIIEYFTHKFNVQWLLDQSEWPDMTGSSCFISFIDDGTLHMVGFDYKRN